MTQAPKDAAVQEAGLRRLRRYNPFVVGLDREGYKRLHLQLFDGELSLVAVPIVDFDGYRAETDYPYFAPALVLSVLAVLLPLAPLLLPALLRIPSPDNLPIFAVLTSAYVCGCIYLCVMAAFHLTAMRTDYSNANSNILAANFVTRAHGIRSIVHTFKRMLRWRRFMRYAMNFGYTFLVPAFAFAIYVVVFRRAWFGNDWTMIAIAGVQFIASFLSLFMFEVGRGNYTRGVDPTLALILMVEEIGGQLLASRQTRLVGANNN